MESSQENLCIELSMSRDKLLAAEECKEILRTQLVSLTEELNNANAVIQCQHGELEKARAREQAAAAERETLVKKAATLEHDFEQSNGAYYALKLAHTHLETRLKSVELNRVKQDKSYEIESVGILISFILVSN